MAEQLDLILPPVAELDAASRAGLEALSALAVREPLERRLVDDGLDRLYREIELPLIAVLARMEATGVALDLEALQVLATEFATEISRLETEIYADVGHEFNLGSPKQLEQILFFELNLPKGKRTKTGYSTDASVLEDLRPAHPMIDKLLEWRIYTKLRSTYVDALPTLMASDGRLHTTFHQAVAATGRLSSSDPNLQNIPIRTPLGRRIRRAFVAGGEDLTLVAADYSQIELRILAHVSGDEHLRDAFARNADLHRETAALVLHKDPSEVTLGERSMAKMVNFGIAYGLSDFGLSERANIPRAEAQAFINTYFATYSGISYYMLAIKEQARTQGFVTTLLGRKRQIPELAARNPTLRAAGERMAINMPIQGTAADIVKIAMIRLDERLRAGGFRARPLLQVHDELLLEVPRDEVDRLVPILRETMEGALPLDVPLTVDIKIGDDWESMTPLTRADAIAAEADEAPTRRLSRPPSARSRRCPNFPRSRRSRATCGRASWARRSPARGCSWARTLRTHTPEAFGEAIAGRRVEAVWRRAKQIVIDLSGDAALTIHLKMTGQLFVVPAETPVDPYVRLVLELADGREVRFRDIRKFGKIGLYGRDPVTGELVTEVGGGAVFAKLGPEPLDPAFSVRDFRRRLRKRSGRLKPLLLDQSFIAGVGNIYADEALWAARLHPLRTAGTLRPPDERHLYDEVRRILAEAVVRRGSSIDDYTAPDGDGSMQEHLQVYQRTGEPCPRCGRPVKRIVIGARSTHFCSWCQRLGAARPQGRGHDPPDDDRRATPVRRTLDGPGRGGDRRADAAGGGPRVVAGTDRAHETGRRDTPRRGPGLGAVADRGMPSDEHPPPDGCHARGRDVRDPRRDRRLDRPGRPDRPRRPQRRGQDHAPPPCRRPRRARPRRGPSQARPDARAARPGGPFRRGVHGLAGPADRRPDRRRPSRSDGRAAGRDGARGAGDRSRLRRAACTSTRSSAATRSTSASRAR